MQDGLRAERLRLREGLGVLLRHGKELHRRLDALRHHSAQEAAVLHQYAEEAAALRQYAEELRIRLEDPALRGILGPWASRRWQILGRKLEGKKGPGRLLGAIHRRLGALAERAYRRAGWEIAVPALAGPSRAAGGVGVDGFGGGGLGDGDPGWPSIDGTPVGPDLPSAELDLAGLGTEPRPEVSIVIPVFNQASLTAQCLRNLRATLWDTPAEILVVGNGSRDETAQLLEQEARKERRLRVLTNATNLGFGPACNIGAAAARGRVLVFLNNDTEPRTAWVEALLTRLAEDPSIGAVGARLVYPDGQLQEAGSIIFKDGSGWNFGRGLTPTLPAFSRAREVDYCSAACLAVPRDLFLKLGGLDPAYAPGYYEDADFCFRLREAGYSVWYEPGAVVVHHEGGTAGRDEKVGLKSYQVTNKAFFAERWQEALDAQWPPDDAFVPLAAHRRPRMLMILPHLPMADFASGDHRLQRLIELLALRFEVVLFADDFHPGFDGTDEDDSYYALQRTLGCKVHFRPRRTLDEIWGVGFDFVWLEFPGIAALYLPDLRRLGSGETIVVDSVDIHFLRRERTAELERDAGALVDSQIEKRRELGVYAEADLILAVTEADREHVLQSLPGSLVEVVPNIHPEVKDFEWRGRGDYVMFVGGFRHPPNVDAVIHFTTAIWPLIRARRPELRFRVVGTAKPPEVLALDGDGVEIVGFVADLEPLYREARAALAPLRVGAGMKGKVGEALSLGVPVVTTGIGAEGMLLRHGEEALVADDPEEFAECVLRLCEDRDLAGHLSRSGREHVARRWGPETVNHHLLVALARAWNRGHLVDWPPAGTDADARAANATGTAPAASTSDGPEIYHRWSEKFLRPKMESVLGVSGVEEFYAHYQSEMRSIGERLDNIEEALARLGDIQESLARFRERES